MPVITPIRPPQGAPNVVIVLLDDVGFGATATFGGPVPSPTGDALAQEGLRYNRFHTTALCSPTRAALLTGRNHHVVNTGNITEWATGYDGYNSCCSMIATSVTRASNAPCHLGSAPTRESTSASMAEHQRPIPMTAGSHSTAPSMRSRSSCDNRRRQPDGGDSAVRRARDSEGREMSFGRTRSCHLCRWPLDGGM